MKQIWNEWKGKKEKWLVPFLIGLLLVIIALPVSEKSDKEETEKEQIRGTAETDYAANLEEELEQVLSKVQGVGEVSVMITLSATSEKVVEKDTEISVENRVEGEQTTSSEEQRETSVYEGSSGEETPYVIKEISPQIAGVLVVAQGGNDPVVIEQITSAVQALFGVESHKIKVMKHH